MDIIARGMAKAIQEQINQGQTGIDTFMCKVDNNDTTPDFLLGKINGADTQLKINVIDNTLVISIDDALLEKINDKSSDGKVCINIDDVSPDYLGNKLLGTTNKVTITKDQVDTNNKLILNIGQDIFDKTLDSANSIIYNKSNSTLQSIKVGNAIDELDSKSEINKSNINNNTFDLDNVKNNQGKIKLNVDDTEDYINNKIDNSTIQIENNKLVVKNINGLIVPVETINLLQGTTSNIQEQINGFTQAFHLLGAKNTKIELDAIVDMQIGDSWIVNTDESQGNVRDWYTYTSSGWIQMGVVEINVRDFLINPINLETEVTGILSQEKIDLTNLVKQSDLINYLDKNTYDSNNNGQVDKSDNSDNLNGNNSDYYTAANNINVLTDNFNKNLTVEDNTVQKALEKLDKLTSGSGSGGDVDLSNYYTKDQTQNMLFTTSNEAKGVILNSINDNNLTINNTFAEVSNAILDKKQAIVEALQNKGIDSVTKSDELSSYAEKINNIVQNSQIKNTKLNKNQGDTYQVILSNPSDITNIATSILEYQPGQSGVVKYDCEFNNADSTQFNEVDNIVFDGTMHQNLNIVNMDMTQDQEEITTNGLIYSCDIDRTDYRRIGKIEDTSNDENNIITITSAYNPVLILANDDIDLNNVDKIDSIVWSATQQNNSKLLLIFSLDSGINWQGYDKLTGTVNNIDISNNNDIENKGISIDSINNMSIDDLFNIRNDSSKIRFGYYFNIEDINDVVQNDKIVLTVDMLGKSAFSKNVDISLGEDNRTITYVFNKNGTYTIVYMDNQN